MAGRAAIAFRLPGMAFGAIRFRHLREVAPEIDRLLSPMVGHKLGSQDRAVCLIVLGEFMAL